MASEIQNDLPSLISTTHRGIGHECIFIVRLTRVFGRSRTPYPSTVNP
jgi:hypothetical protein